MSQINSHSKIQQKFRKEIHFSLNPLKKLNNSTNQNNNKKDNSEKKIPSKEKEHYLLLKKINLKENENKKYSNAIKNIFQKPEFFLNTVYKGKKVIVGKNYKTIKGIKELFDYCLRRNKRRKIVNNKFQMKSLNFFQKFFKRKNIIFRRHRDITFESSSFEESSKTINLCPSENGVKNIPISDNELNLLYKQFELREEKNKENKIKYCSSNKFFNRSTAFGINKMLNLQEKILETSKKSIKIDQKVVNKIMNATSKQKDKILMNGSKNIFVLKGQSLDKEFQKFNTSYPNFNKIMRNWIFNFRKNKQEEQKKELKSPEEIILVNKNLTLSKNKSEVNIRNKLYEKLNINNNMKKSASNNMNILDRRKTNDILKNKNNNLNNSVNIKSLHNLFIQGKNLLNHEIKLSKELCGKRKNLFKYSFSPDEVSSFLMAKSNSVRNIHNPKAIINSMEIHKFSS